LVSPLKTLVLASAVAVVALLPLFGDPRVTPVTHPIWARMLLRALEMTEALRVSTHASEVFAMLSWRESLTYPAGHYARGDGVTVGERGAWSGVAASEGTGQVVYPLAVVGAGDYQIRLRLAGAPERPAAAEIVPTGEGAPPKTLTFIPTASVDWVRGGPTHLDPGTYTVTLLLPQGSWLEYIEVAPPCLNPIEPAGGWKPAAPTTVEDVAVTALKALDLENELPPADTALERAGGDFQVEAAAPSAPGQGIEALALRAGPNGLRAVLSVDLPEAGLYTLSVFGVTGAGQRWLADGCRKAILCPSEAAGWRAVMSQHFGAGRHAFTVALANGAAVERVRLERKKELATDYLATLRGLGFDPGPDGPVDRERALAAMHFIHDQRSSLRARVCGDVILPALGSPQVAQAGAAVAPPPRVGQPPLPLDPVLLSPQPPASPVRPLAAGEIAGPHS
jgi:hypothetical protein